MSDNLSGAPHPKRVLTSLEIATGYANLAPATAFFVGGYILAKNVLRSLFELSLDRWPVISDGLVFIALGYGALKRSRICATLLIAYWILSRSRMWLMPNWDRIAGLVVFGTVTVGFIAGWFGLMRYHRLKKASNHQSQRPQAAVAHLER